MRHENRPELGSSRSCEGMDTEALSLFLTSLVRSLIVRGGGHGTSAENEDHAQHRIATGRERAGEGTGQGKKRKKDTKNSECGGDGVSFPSACSLDPDVLLPVVSVS